MSTTVSTMGTEQSAPATSDGIGLSGALTCSLFPYHIMIDADFAIQQVGNQLPTLLRTSQCNLIGKNLADFFLPKHPLARRHWNWQWLQFQQDQPFQLETVPEESQSNSIPLLQFKTTIVQVSHSPVIAMLILTPDTESFQDLSNYNMTLSDLPAHSGHRQLVLAKEQLQTQKNNAQTMEQLQQSLEREKELLESLLPEHAAEGLRAGKTVEPRLHENVTFFFSDIVGFTNICKHLEPSQVIGMLNQLYSIMDFLCGKFGLFKVETIGDGK